VAFRKGVFVFEYPILLVFPAAMAFAAAMDLLTLTIPNRVSLGLLAAFLLAAALTGIGWTKFALHLAAGGAMLLVGFLMFTRGWVGGGDAKLLAATSLWLGFDNLFVYAILVSFAGGVLAASILLFRSVIPPVWVAGQDWAMRLHDDKTGIPYGIALAAAALWVYPSTHWFASLAG
jgi:prepilin peptidase CpaA